MNYAAEWTQACDEIDRLKAKVDDLKALLLEAREVVADHAHLCETVLNAREIAKLDREWLVAVDEQLKS